MRFISCLLVALALWASPVNAQISNPPVLNATITPQGRLTLTTATPVMTATVSAAATIFYTPYVGNIVPLFDGTNMIMTACAETSNITTNSAVGSAGPAAVAASSAYDLFVWSNAGVCTLTRGPVWTNVTSRSAGTALVRQNGIQLNSVTITNGPAASRGTWVGTVSSNAGSTIDYIFGASASGGTAASLQVWNAYNRVMTGTKVTDSGVGYAYTTATIRQARASAGNQISFVVGLSEETITASYSTFNGLLAAVGAFMRVGFGFDSTTTFGDQFGQVGNNVAVANSLAFGISTVWQPGIGVHVLSANESGDATNANNFDNNSTNVLAATISN